MISAALSRLHSSTKRISRPGLAQGCSMQHGRRCSMQPWAPTSCAGAHLAAKRPREKRWPARCTRQPQPSDHAQALSDRPGAPSKCWCCGGGCLRECGRQIRRHAQRVRLRVEHIHVRRQRGRRAEQQVQVLERLCRPNKQQRIMLRLPGHAAGCTGRMAGGVPEHLCLHFWCSCMEPHDGKLAKSKSNFSIPVSVPEHDSRSMTPGWKLCPHA